jgi:hypothetical protein
MLDFGAFSLGLAQARNGFASLVPGSARRFPAWATEALISAMTWTGVFRMGLIKTSIFIGRDDNRTKSAFVDFTP